MGDSAIQSPVGLLADVGLVARPWKFRQYSRVPAPRAVGVAGRVACRDQKPWQQLLVHEPRRRPAPP